MYLGLGSNVGDRAANLRSAIRALADLGTVTGVSDVYESDAVGFTDQPRFWNMAVSLRTALDPVELLLETRQTETRLGRVPTFPKGPRVLDIDVLLWGDRIVESSLLNVPHPALMDRPFVLRPLLDLDPDLTHPVTRERLDERLQTLYMSGAAAAPDRIGPVRDVLGEDSARQVDPAEDRGGDA